MIRVSYGIFLFCCNRTEQYRSRALKGIDQTSTSFQRRFEPTVLIFELTQADRKQITPDKYYFSPDIQELLLHII